MKRRDHLEIIVVLKKPSFVLWDTERGLGGTNDLNGFGSCLSEEESGSVGSVGLFCLEEKVRGR